MSSSDRDEEAKREAGVYKQVAVFRQLATQNEETPQLVSRARHCSLRFVFGQARRAGRSNVLHNKVQK